MADVINGNGRIILDGSGVEDAVFYWLTISDEPGKLVAEGSISASEVLLRKVKNAKRATLALEDGPQCSATSPVLPSLADCAWMSELEANFLIEVSYGISGYEVHRCPRY